MSDSNGNELNNLEKALIDAIDMCDTIGRNLNDFNITDQAELNQNINKYVEALNLIKDENERISDLTVPLDLLQFMNQNGDLNQYMRKLLTKIMDSHKLLKKQVYTANRLENDILTEVGKSNLDVVKNYLEKNSVKK